MKNENYTLIPIKNNYKQHPRGLRGDYAKITITIPFEMWKQLRKLGIDKRIEGQKDSDLSSQIREAINFWMNRTQDCGV